MNSEGTVPELDVNNQENAQGSSTNNEEDVPEFVIENQEIVPEPPLDNHENASQFITDNQENSPEFVMNTEEIDPRSSMNNEEITPQFAMNHEEIVPRSSMNNEEITPKFVMNNQENATKNNSGNFAIDFIRALACLFVLSFDAGYFYMDGFGDGEDVFEGVCWHIIINGFCRACFPLLFMLIGYMLLPINTEFFTFLKSTVTKIVYPFIFWCVIYALFAMVYDGTDLFAVIKNVWGIIFNFGTLSGNLWYIYIIIGLLMFLPILSPWVKEATQNQLEYFLTIWSIVSVFLYTIHVSSDIWGQCILNERHMLHNFQGYIGYVIYGYYIKQFIHNKRFFSGLFMFIFGSISNISFGISYMQLTPLKEIDIGKLEVLWNFESGLSVIQSLGLFYMFKDIKCQNSKIRSLISEIADKSLGILLTHMIFQYVMFSYLEPLKSENPPLMILIFTVFSFIFSYLLVKGISFLPSPYNHYIIG